MGDPLAALLVLGLVLVLVLVRGSHGRQRF
jgi:hypothetical protein